MVYMMVGIQGAGKTTFARSLSEKLNIKIVSTDGVRKENPGIEEAKVFPTVYKECARLINKGEDIIYDATNITPRVRQRFKDEVMKYGAEPVVGIYYFDTSLNDCVNRVSIRNTLDGELYLPLDVIPSFSSKLIVPTLDEGFSFIKIVRNGIVVDEL